MHSIWRRSKMCSRPWLCIQFEDAARCGDNHGYTFNVKVPKDVEMWNDSYHSLQPFFFDLDSTLALVSLLLILTRPFLISSYFLTPHIHFSQYHCIVPNQSPSLVAFRWCTRICIIHHAMLAFPSHVLYFFSLSSKKHVSITQYSTIDYLQFSNHALTLCVVCLVSRYQSLRSALPLSLNNRLSPFQLLTGPFFCWSIYIFRLFEPIHSIHCLTPIPLSASAFLPDHRYPATPSSSPPHKTTSSGTRLLSYIIWQYTYYYD